MPGTPSNDRAILRTQRVLSTCLIKGEPPLEEVLSDPIVLLRAQRAGLTKEGLRALCDSSRERLLASCRRQ